MEVIDKQIDEWQKGLGSAFLDSTDLKDNFAVIANIQAYVVNRSFNFNSGFSYGVIKQQEKNK